MYDLLEQDLKTHYGEVGYLSNALEDLHRKNNNAYVIQAVAQHIPVSIGDDISEEERSAHLSNHAYAIVSGLIQDTYNAAKEVVSSIAWKSIVQMGNVPDTLDTMIAYLNNIQNEVRKKLVQSVNWVGSRLKSFYQYILQLLPEAKTSWFSSVWKSLSFDWLSEKLSSAAKYTVRQLAQGMHVLLVALRDIVYIAIEKMSIMLGSVMHGVLVLGDKFSKSKRSVIRSLYFYASCNADMCRYAPFSINTTMSRVEAYRSQLGRVSRQVLASIREDVAKDKSKQEEMEIILRDKQNNPFYHFYEAVFGASELVLDWVLEFFSWFGTTLKRIVSCARRAIESTFYYAHLFSLAIGNDVKQVMDYMQSTRDPISLRKAVETAETLLETSSKLPVERREALERAVRLSNEVLNDVYFEQNKRVVFSRDAIKTSEQFEMNHVVADLLTSIQLEDAPIDPNQVNKIVQFYTGRSLQNEYIVQQEALAHLEAQYTLAVSSVLDGIGISIEEIGIRADNTKADTDDEEEDLDPDDDPNSILYLQNQFEQSEQDLSEALKGLENFEVSSSQNIVRNASYMLTAERLANQIQTAVKKRNDNALQLVSEDAFTDMSLLMLDQQNTSARTTHMNLFIDVVLKFIRRNELAGKLKKKMRPVYRLKQKWASWAGLVGAAMPFFLIALNTYYGDAAPIFQGDEGFATRWYRRIPYLGSLPSVSILGGLNLKTWMNVLKHFSDVDVAKVLDIPVLAEYVTIVITMIPVTIAFSYFAYFVMSSFVSLSIDAQYHVGSREFQEDERGVQITRFTENRWRVWLLKMGPAFKITATYAFERITGMWIGLLTGKIDAVKQAFSGLPVLLSAANPLGSIMESASNAVPTEGKLKSWARKINLLPSTQVLKDINPDDITTSNVAPLLYGNIRRILTNLPANHPLLTGGAIITRLEERQKVALSQESRPVVEEVDDEDDQAFLAALRAATKK